MASKKPQPVKIPNIRQLPSGAWTCQIRIGSAGERQSISITDDDYDTVYAKAYAYKTGIIKAKSAPVVSTVGDALSRYISNRENISSPSTIRGYNTIARNRLKSLQARPISSLTPNMVQQAINAESGKCSPKTLQNAWSFFRSAIIEAGGEAFDPRLPQVPPAEKLYLLPEQIPVMLEEIKGSRYEAAILLGLWSCRRSEIYGLQWDMVDMKKRTIRICRTLVQQTDNSYVLKEIAKNKSSHRIIPISDQLYAALEREPDKTGAVVRHSPNNLYDAVNSICRRLGFPLVGVHGLRHSFASLGYKLGIPAKIMRQIGGWESDDIMMKIYTHISTRDVNDAAAEILKFFNNG